MPCRGRDQTGHPIVAMDKIRLYIGDDIIDNLPLKSKSDFKVFPAVIGIDITHIEKSPVFGKMNLFIRHFSPDGL